VTVPRRSAIGEPSAKIAVARAVTSDSVVLRATDDWSDLADEGGEGQVAQAIPHLWSMNM